MNTTNFSLIPDFFKLTVHDENNVHSDQPHEFILHNIIDSLCGHGPGLNLKQLVPLGQTENAKSMSLIHVENVLVAVKAFILRVFSLNLNQEEV